MFIKIEGNSVKYIEEKILKEVKTEDFVNFIESNSGVSTGLLPNNCRMMFQKGDKAVYCVELPAGVVPFNFEGDYYNLSVPFTQFWFGVNISAGSICTTYVTVTKTPLSSMEDRLFVSPYLNIFTRDDEYSMGNVCVGNMRVPTDVPVCAKISSFVSLFFESEANDDLCFTPPSGFDSNYDEHESYIEEWAEKTNKDRFFMIGPDTSFGNYMNNTPKELVDYIFGRL